MFYCVVYRVVYWFSCCDGFPLDRWFAVVLLDGFCWMVFLIMEVLIDALTLDGRS